MNFYTIIIYTGLITEIHVRYIGKMTLCVDRLTQFEAGNTANWVYSLKYIFF